MAKKKNTEKMVEEEMIEEEVVEEEDDIVKVAEASTPATTVNTSSNAYE